jgi:hypothetical protein
MIKKYFAGIGSRAIPHAIIPKIEESCKILIDQKYILRSGGAEGADTFFENVYDKFGGKKEIYLPWKDFNENKSNMYPKSEEEWADAFRLAEQFHPRWNQLSNYAKFLHARNGFQVLGEDLATPSLFVLCWTPEGKEMGGTAQCMRISNSYSIPIYNLAIDVHIQQLENFLNISNIFAK